MDHFVLLDNTTQSTGLLGSSGGFIFMGAILVVFWLFFIRPQAKRQKDQKKFVEDLGKGDKVVTVSGIHGVINKVNDDGTLSIEVSPGSYLKMERTAVSMDMTKTLNKPVSTDKK